MTYFDTFLHHDGQSIQDILGIMTLSDGSQANVEGYRQTLEKRPRLKKVRAIIGSRTPTYFVTKETNVTVETRSDIDRESTLSHLASRDYVGSRDCSMVYHTCVRPGRLYLDADDWATAPLGPDTMAILETLGYTPYKDAGAERSLVGLYKQMKEPRSLNRSS